MTKEENQLTSPTFAPRLIARLGLVFLVGTAAWVLIARIFRPEAGDVRTQVQLETNLPATGFNQALGDRELTFPVDFGPHEDYQSEWWYYTGNLSTEDGARFGYQLTFFRRALAPPDDVADRPSAWAADQVYFAHFTISDVEGGNFEAFERFSRGAAGLAGARAAPYEVWLESWSVRELTPGMFKLEARENGFELDLHLTDMKGPILQGKDGYSQKGPGTGAASYYYSLTNLKSAGTMTIGNTVFQVEGKSWMDHEFSTSALNADQIGWDWFSIQLENDTELMLFHIRQADGTIDPFSSGALIEADGSVQHLDRDEFEIRSWDVWTSPKSGAEYPARWTVTVPMADLVLEITPLLADQELEVSFVYWEGAVSVTGTWAGESVGGFGYVELTGYLESFAEVF